MKGILVNFSADALWWRLHNQSVRDLASVLLGPSPWHTGAELPIRSILGERGFRFLLALDENPAQLHHFLERYQPFHHRLGVYAEMLFKFWLTHVPHIQLLKDHFVVEDNGRSVGEIDFLVEMNEEVWQVELACKYYGGIHLLGLNPTDKWEHKFRKLQSQLNYYQYPSVQAAVFAHQKQIKQSVSVTRGMIFTCPHSTHVLPKAINQNAWRGVAIYQWQEWIDANCCDFEAVRYVILSRMNFLSPCYVQFSQTLSWEEVSQISEGMVAVVSPRKNGLWHEINRIMKFPQKEMD